MLRINQARQNKAVVVPKAVVQEKEPRRTRRKAPRLSAANGVWNYKEPSSATKLGTLSVLGPSALQDHRCGICTKVHHLLTKTRSRNFTVHAFSASTSGSEQSTTRPWTILLPPEPGIEDFILARDHQTVERRSDLHTMASILEVLKKLIPEQGIKTNMQVIRWILQECTPQARYH